MKDAAIFIDVCKFLRGGGVTSKKTGTRIIFTLQSGVPVRGEKRRGEKESVNIGAFKVLFSFIHIRSSTCVCVCVEPGSGYTVCA